MQPSLSRISRFLVVAVWTSLAAPSAFAFPPPIEVNAPAATKSSSGYYVATLGPNLQQATANLETPLMLCKVSVSADSRVGQAVTTDGFGTCIPLDGYGAFPAAPACTGVNIFKLDIEGIALLTGDITVMGYKITTGQTPTGTPIEIRSWEEFLALLPVDAGYATPQGIAGGFRPQVPLTYTGFTLRVKITQGDGTTVSEWATFTLIDSVNDVAWANAVWTQYLAQWTIKRIEPSSTVSTTATTTIQPSSTSLTTEPLTTQSDLTVSTTEPLQVNP